MMKLIRRLKSSTTDEVLLRTIDIVATTPENSWVPAFNRVQDEVRLVQTAASATGTNRDADGLRQIVDSIRSPGSLCSALIRFYYATVSYELEKRWLHSSFHHHLIRTQDGSVGTG